ncbi:CHAT domain-containing protein [Nostoc sp.]|uniref:CHAT domain-containing protein n=1 Tax=Nostoc sp. TaxID=1180 RepID=UPI002FFA51F5
MHLNKKSLANSFVSFCLVCLFSISYPFLALSVLAKTTLDSHNEFTELIKEGEQNLNIGKLKEALDKFQKAQRIAQQIDTPWDELEVLLKIGEVYLALNRPKEAEEIFQEIITIAKNNDALWWKQKSIFEIGKIYLRQAYSNQAQKYFIQLLTDQKTDDYQNGRNDLKGVWEVYLELNQPEKALELFQQILVISQQKNEPQCKLDTLMIIGTAYLQLKQFNQALEFFQQALSIAKEFEKQWEEREALRIIGDVYLKLNQPSQAQDFFLKFLDLSKKIDARQGQQEAVRIIYETYLNLRQIDQSQKLFLQTIATYQKSGDSVKESEILVDVGEFHLNKKQLVQARNFFLQAALIHRRLKNHSKEAETYVDIGRQYLGSDKLELALEFFIKAFSIQQKISDFKGEVNSLERMGEIYRRLEQYQKAIEVYQQSLKVYKQVRNHQGEADSLVHLGRSYQDLKQYEQAIKFYQLALPIYNRFGIDKSYYTEADVVINLGASYHEVGEYNNEINLYNSFLTKIPSNKGYKISEILTLLGQAYLKIGQVQKGNELQKQSRIIAQPLASRAALPEPLNELGDAYLSLGQYERAIEFYLSALNSRKNPIEKAAAFNNLGITYAYLGQYQKAINYYQSSQTTLKNYKNYPIKEDNEYSYFRGNSDYNSISSLEAKILNNLANTYYFLGEYPKAIELHQQSLSIARQIKNLEIEASSLNNLGDAYVALKQYPKALSFYQSSLAIFQQIEDFLREANCLNNLGNVYFLIGEYQKSIDLYQQALNIDRKIQNRQGEADTLNNLGNAYSAQGKYNESLTVYQQSLATLRDIGSRRGESVALSNIGSLLEKQNQPELAIVFYKQSVNVRESIRQNIRTLPREQQESYTQTVEDTYRSLADLLLKQDRVLEAQQVLDLLKVQELDDYFRNVRGTDKKLIILFPEQKILEKYNALQKKPIQLGQELTELRKIPEASRSQVQQQQIAQRVQIEEQLNNQFNQFINSPDVVKLVNQLTREVKRQNIDLADLDAFRDDLRRLNAVMLYPLILDDRLELVITTPDAPPLRRTVKVKREELNEVIVEFRSALQYRRDNVKVPAQKLYNWLIKPLEADLKQAKATTIIYAPDGQLRYIPLAALYDGNQWLVQNYRINNITAKSLTNFNNIHESKLKVLAGAFADIKLSYPVRIGQEEYSLRGLPFAGQEVANLAATISDTTKLLDKDFSLAAIKPRMNEFSIVHLATHAAFVPGQPEDSFILFGNGDRPTLRDIESWTLNNVDLVVLSGCETGIGGKFGNGEEILGLGYQFQSRGARAVIASLWAVDDGGTQALMNPFYAILKRGNISKAEALRQAQIALITTNKNTDGKQRRSSIEIKGINNNLASSVSDRLSHPYYWAPFILIGNGL